VARRRGSHLAKGKGRGRDSGKDNQQRSSHQELHLPGLFLNEQNEEQWTEIRSG
jgi:hypothetical protein